VTVSSLGPVQNMHVEVSGLPKQTGFDFFVIQVPKSPFGLSWYQGDIDTDANGFGVGDFTGIFSDETFAVAPGVSPAPRTINRPPFPDAASNPATGPIQMYHLGLWFDSPTAAANAGCADTVTPFNGLHNAGIQVLNTGTFPDISGPLLGLR
jgi:hypothetical protein